MVDRYTKVVLTVIALALAVSALKPFVLAPLVLAAAPEGSIDFGGVQSVDVPRAWGRFVGASDKSLFFEASDGTIRKQPVGTAGTHWVRK